MTTGWTSSDDSEMCGCSAIITRFVPENVPVVQIAGNDGNIFLRLDDARALARWLLDETAKHGYVISETHTHGPS